MHRREFLKTLALIPVLGAGMLVSDPEDLPEDGAKILSSATPTSIQWGPFWVTIDTPRGVCLSRESYEDGFPGIEKSEYWRLPADESDELIDLRLDGEDLLVIGKLNSYRFIL